MPSEISHLAHHDMSTLVKIPSWPWTEHIWHSSEFYRKLEIVVKGFMKIYERFLLEFKTSKPLSSVCLTQIGPVLVQVSCVRYWRQFTTFQKVIFGVACVTVLVMFAGSNADDTNARKQRNVPQYASKEDADSLHAAIEKLRTQNSQLKSALSRTFY